MALVAAFVLGAKKACYVRSSYRYNSVIDCHVRNTLAFRADIEKAFDDLKKQINSKTDKPLFVRVNQSGELESEKEFKMWLAMANEYKNIKFYLYTKAFVFVMPSIKAGLIPKNVTILFSVWHEYGIKEFLDCMDCDCVKAFVYIDKAFTIAKYAKYGINITTTCKAYNEKGKLNHEITCERCKSVSIGLQNIK